MTWFDDMFIDQWDEEYMDGQPPCEAENAKVLHDTPLAMLVQCDDGIAWFPRKVAWIHEDILMYEYYFNPVWFPTSASAIEGDYV